MEKMKIGLWKVTEMEICYSYEDEIECYEIECYDLMTQKWKGYKHEFEPKSLKEL